MIRITNAFNKTQNKQPNLGSFCVLAEVIKNRGLTYDSTSRIFTKLVPKEDYVKNERRGLIKYLHILSNPLFDNKLETKNEL